MAVGLAQQIQEDFSGGMFRSGPAERIPANGAADLTNTLISRNGAITKRGGAAYRADAYGSGLRLIWDGWLANGQHTLIASTTSFAKVVGTTNTSLGGSGMTRSGRPAVYAGKIYMPGGFTYDGTTAASEAHSSPYYAIAGNRLLLAEGSKVRVSHAGKPDEAFDANDFHEIPGGIEILGLEGLRESAAVFTTGGVWVINGLQHELVDESGNVLRTQDLYNQELVLWASGGIAAWEGALIVPSTEAVYLLSLGVSSEKAQSLVRISDPIVDLYQEYVRSGYAPGQATVHQNHYLLPIVGAGDVIDVLVCRLDLPSRPWTHLNGQGAKVAALTTRVVSGFSRTPELIGALYSASESRAVTLSYFQPTANVEHDQDGTIPNWTITTRAYATGNNVPNTVTRLKLRYQLVGSSSPTIKCGVSSESAPASSSASWGTAIWGAFDWATPSGQSFAALDGEAPVDLDGSEPYLWHPRKKVRYIQFRLSSHDATSQLAIRSLELSVRPQGRA